MFSMIAFGVFALLGVALFIIGLVQAIGSEMFFRGAWVVGIPFSIMSAVCFGIAWYIAPFSISIH